jgi:hypothetical protein
MFHLDRTTSTAFREERATRARPVGWPGLVLARPEGLAARARPAAQLDLVCPGVQVDLVRPGVQVDRHHPVVRFGPQDRVHPAALARVLDLAGRFVLVLDWLCDPTPILGPRPVSSRCCLTEVPPSTAHRYCRSPPLRSRSRQHRRLCLQQWSAPTRSICSWIELIKKYEVAGVCQRLVGLLICRISAQACACSVQ